MSNENNQQDSTFRDWHLRWGGIWKEQSQVEIPLFPSYYSYLLKLAPGVGLVDIYPWLAELMFFSVAVDVDVDAKSDSEAQSKHLAPLNVVSIFVDDNSDNVAFSRLNVDRRKTADPIKELLTLQDSDHGLRETSHAPKLFMVDTFGQFKDTKADSSEMSQEDDAPYVASSLVGAGNPMQMMRRFTIIGELPLKRENGTRQVFLGTDLGDLNCFVINSISNLYRSMGVRDAMLLVRAIMEKGVWKAAKERQEQPDSDKITLIDNKGMLFAILHDEVFPKEDTMYIETFFDGVIRFEKHLISQSRKVCFRFERFPPPVPGRNTHATGHPFQPDFSASWTCKVNEDGRLTIDRVPKGEENDDETK
ncbi:MAG: hypothetical protein HQL90_13270 [Magnetococcales bacterium]|nr:hypothetical protein [Magnetococcales bacterium]